MMKVCSCSFAMASYLFTMVSLADTRFASRSHGVLNQLLKVDNLALLKGNLNSSLPEKWYKQKLDHFSEDDRTWKQRYFENWEFYQPGGPVFLMIGGEGAISDGYLTGAFVNSDLAKTFKGLQVVVEHRFYGKSQPLNDLATGNLKYLTSQQALADLASFTDWYNEEIRSSHGSSQKPKWFCLGGSYPGNLAAWYRAKYPDHVEGCIASSAPVFAKEDFYEYGEMVWRAMASGGNDAIAEKLHAGYAELAEALTVPTLAAKREVLQALNACPHSVISANDFAQLEQSISTAMSGVVQYNNSMPSKGNIAAFQAAIQRADTPLQAALDVTRMLNVTVDPENSSECIDFSLRSLYDELSNVAPGSSSADGRAWFWQTCNEFGYFQTMRVPSLFKGRTMFTAGASAPALWQGLCEAVFDVEAEDVEDRVRETNRYYGGLQPNVSRVLFTNGQYDPWSELAIKRIPAQLQGKDVHSIIVENGSHCVGLYSSRPGQPPMVFDLHDKLKQLFGTWGAVPNSAQLIQI